MKLDKMKARKLTIFTLICCLVISGCFLGKNLISDAGDMEIVIDGLTVVVPDNMMCADVSSFLNVRINPSANSDVIAKLYPGDTVEYVGESGNWTMVNLDGQIGYVFSKYTVRGADLKKYIKKNLDKFTIEGTVLKKSYTPVYTKKELVGSEEPSYTMNGKITAKTTVYATKSSNSKILNETEKVEKWMVIADGLRFREKASTDAKIFCNLYRGTYLNVISDNNEEWLKIKYNDKVGFIAREYAKVVTVKEPKSNLLGSIKKGEEVTVTKLWKNWAEISYEDKTSYIKRKAIDVAAKLNTSNKNVVTLAENNSKCYVLDVEKNVARVKIDGKKGYLATSAIRANIYFSDIKVDEDAVKKAARQITTNSLASSGQSNTILENSSLGNASKDRQELVKFAVQFVGNKYVWGGNSLTSGVDCSGFTQQVYAHFGVKINRCSFEQVKNGKQITFDKLQPGDLIFYYNKSLKRIGHVAMYIGDGKIVHAKSKKSGIVTDNWNYSTPYKAVTILGNK